VNLSVIKHHIVDQGERAARQLFAHGWLPFVASGLTAWLWTSLQRQSLVVGMTWLAVGAAYLLVRTRGRRAAPVL